MIEYLLKNVGEVIKVEKVSDKECTIISDALFDDGNPYDVALRKKPNGKWCFADRKSLIKHMEPLYDLGAEDVKLCVKRVLEVYGFKMSSGELICDVEDETLLMYKYFQFVSCISTLINMYAFFDEPEDK